MKNLKNNLCLFNFVLLILLIVACEKEKDAPSSPSHPFNNKTTAVFNPSLRYGSMTDQEGNVYRTITIGTQTWMAENLRTTHFRNGDSIPEVTQNALWNKLLTAAYCNYNNTTNSEDIATYGRLYNSFAVTDIRSIAPTGWHVSTDAEWTILTLFLRGDSIAGGKLKETGTTHWKDMNKTTTACGFTALPAGFRDSFYGFCLGLGGNASYWTSTPVDSTLVFGRTLSSSYIIARGEYSIVYGFSVRCVKD